MTYILLVFLSHELEKVVGKLGVIRFKSGYYAYVGSAKKNFKHRIKRHISKDKKLFWHIDYLLCDEDVMVERIFWVDDVIEHEVARILNSLGFYVIKGFGSSDCDCIGHLFYVEDVSKLEGIVRGVGFKMFLG